MKILLVDDDPFFMKILMTLLSGHVGPVDAVHSAEQALELLRTANYDLLITDLVMEGVNGIDLIQIALREQLVDRDHLFVVTGLPKNTLLVESIRKSGIQVLPKPFTAKQFTHAMKSIAQKGV